MITVNCSHCKAVLEMDDAFAGGVCRCHYCGTIQSVPAHARRVPAQSAAATPAARANGAAAPAKSSNGDGLDALADVVASSGLSRGALRSAPPQPAAPAVRHVDYAQPPQQKKLLVPLIIAGGVIALLLVLVAYLLFATTTTVPATISGTGGARGTPPGVPGGEAAVVVPKGPHFCGISLDGIPSVVFVVDRGRATAELFDTLKEAIYRSLESLEPGQKFQIIFWDNADPAAAYPKEGLVDVSAQEIEAARAQFADVLAEGRAKPDGAVRRAAKSRPVAIVIVTGKAFDLDEGLVRTVQDAVKGTTTKVHTIALRSDDGNTVLKEIADKTHGEFKVITAKELRDYSY